jgi:hypothetical protein
MSFHLERDGWNAYGRKEIIQQAMWLIDDRFLDLKVRTNTYQVEGDHPLVYDDTWNITNLNAYYSNKGYRDILWYQLTALRSVAKKPEIYIFADYQPKVPGYAWANGNLVKTIHSKDGVKVEGNFALALNTAYLGGPGVFSDPYFWSAVIAHEMCHNLGHRHPDPNDPRYNFCQLVAHSWATYSGGNYKHGLELRLIQCGGPWKGGGGS